MWLRSERAAFFSPLSKACSKVATASVNSPSASCSCAEPTSTAYGSASAGCGATSSPTRRRKRGGPSKYTQAVAATTQNASPAKDQARPRPLALRSCGIREGSVDGIPEGPAGRGLIKGFSSGVGKYGTDATSASTLAVSTAVGSAGGPFGLCPSTSACLSASAISAALLKRC